MIRERARSLTKNKSIGDIRNEGRADDFYQTLINKKRIRYIVLYNTCLILTRKCTAVKRSREKFKDQIVQIEDIQGKPAL